MKFKCMKKFLLIISILLICNTCYGVTISTDGTYRNPYQRMWSDGEKKKGCKFNTELQMCESASMNFQSMKAYNDYKPDKYYCIGGYLYHLYGLTRTPEKVRVKEFGSEFQTCSKQNDVWFDTVDDFKYWYSQGNR